MAIYLSNRNGNGQTDEEGHYRFTSSMWGGDVIDGVNVTQNSPLGMSVLIQPGDFKIDTAAGYAYQGWIDTADEVTISAANPSNPRLDRIVLYVDLNETTAASPANNPGIIKSMAVAGTPAAVPAAPNNAAVNSAVGSGNPWIEVARVLVNSSVTQITDGNITDSREFVTAPANSVGTSQLKNGEVTTAKIAWPTLLVESSSNPSGFSTSSTSAVVITGTPISITVPAGVTKIKVSAAVRVNNTENFLNTHIAIYKGGSSIASAITRNLSGGASQFNDAVPLLALDSVSGGQNITYDIRCAVSGTSGTTTIPANGGVLIVEAVG